MTDKNNEVFGEELRVEVGELDDSPKLAEKDPPDQSDGQETENVGNSAKQEGSLSDQSTGAETEGGQNDIDLEAAGNAIANKVMEDRAAHDAASGVKNNETQEECTQCGHCPKTWSLRKRAAELGASLMEIRNAARSGKLQQLIDRKEDDMLEDLASVQ